MDRSTKESVIDEFRSSVEEAKSVILAKFSGLTGDESVALRTALREHGVNWRVMKNTLAKRAIAGTDMEVLNDELYGPTAWAYSTEDPVSTAKALVKYLESSKTEHIEIKTGYLGGKLLNVDRVKALASMPGKDELRSKLLSLFQANQTKFVRVLSAAPTKFLQVLTARKNDLG